MKSKISWRVSLSHFLPTFIAHVTVTNISMKVDPIWNIFGTQSETLFWIGDGLQTCFRVDLNPLKNEVRHVFITRCEAGTECDTKLQLCNKISQPILIYQPTLFSERRKHILLIMLLVSVKNDTL